jgi:thiamine-phosphate pyrophosphorylase
VLPIPCLALVTDRRLCPAGSLVARVKQAVAGGVDLVQLREKDLPARELLDLAQQLREITRGKALFVVNDRVDVALACAADGVQLGEEGLPAPVARRLLGEGLLVGRSVHSVAGATQAEAQGADFLLAGTVFPSLSHPQGRPAGAGLLRQVRGAVRIPLLGIGGVTAANVGQVMAAGAQGAAVIQAILSAQDPALAAAELRAAMLQAWVESQQMAQQRQ